MARPSALPNWASAATYVSGPGIGAVTKIDPGAGQTADGWRPNQQPPPQWQNFWQNLVAQWAAYFDEPGTNASTATPLASRSVTRVQRGTWDHFDPTFSHIDAIGDGTGGSLVNNIGSVVFDNTTGAGAGTAVTLVLDLPHNSVLANIDITFKAGTGHTALPNGHKFQVRLIIQDVTDGSATATSFVIDPSASTGVYEAAHTFSLTPSPITVNAPQFRYILQGIAETGTGTTVANGGRIIGVQTTCTVTSQDPGGC